MTAVVGVRARRLARRLWHRYPRPVYALALAACALSLGYSLLTPMHYAPDETNHMDLVLELRQEYRYGSPYDTLFSASVWATRDEVRFQEGRRHLAAELAPPRGSRPSLAALGGRATTDDKFNQIPQHPPGYTILLAAPTGLVDGLWPGDRPWDQDLWLLRLFTVPLVGLVVLLAAEAARAAGLPPGGVVIAATAPLLVPQLIWLGGTVNNDNLLVPAMAAVTVGVIRIARGDLSRRTALCTGVALGCALFVKPFALVGPLWVLGAYMLSTRERPRRAMTGLSIAAATSFVAGGFWYLLNLVRFGTLVPARRSLPLQPGFEADLGQYLDRYVPGMRHSFFGQFGWNELRLWEPYVVWVGWLGLALMLVPVVRRQSVAGLWLPILGVVTVAFAFAYRGHVRTGLYPAIQGRYLYGAFAALAVLVAAGVTTLAGRRLRWAPLVGLAIATLGHVMAVQVMLERWFGPEGGDLGAQLSALIDWSPWPLGLLLFAAVAISCCVGWLLVESVAFARSHGESGFA